MTSHLGELTIWWAAAFSLAQAFSGIVLSRKNIRKFHAFSRYSSYVQALFALSALGVLSYAHLMLDFSWFTVFAHTHTHLPPLYRVGAVWSSAEGSMLLWCVILSLWSAGFAFCRPHPPSLSLLGFLGFSFWILLIFFFDPFATLSHTPLQGLGLNPLLHDPALMIHPPLLYLGYVGLAAPFCLALTHPEPKGVVQWTLIPWVFLTLGLLTGGVWAYYELGWGGWWFWDPVENVALLPWLWAAGVIHARKQTLEKAWVSRLFAILGFLFVLWGTTLTRSGVLASVHNFAPLPERTLPLIVLAITWTLVACGLFFWRCLKETQSAPSSPFTIPKALYGVPLLFFGASALLVACGTFLPVWLGPNLHMEAPFYNQAIFLLMLMPFSLLPIIPFWRTLPQLFPSAILALALIWGISVFAFVPSLKALLCLGLALWMGAGTLPLFRNSRQWSQACAHLGVAFCLGGISCASFWKVEIEQPMQRGAMLQLGSHTLHLQNVTVKRGTLFDTECGDFLLDGQRHLRPERRLYHSQELLTTETAIHTAPLRDIYLVLGDYIDTGTWLVRATLYPGLWGLWLGGLLIAFGGLLALRRRRF